jgi:hypothetical protein
MVRLCKKRELGSKCGIWLWIRIVCLHVTNYKKFSFNKVLRWTLGADHSTVATIPAKKMTISFWVDLFLIVSCTVQHYFVELVLRLQSLFGSFISFDLLICGQFVCTVICFRFRVYRILFFIFTSSLPP